MPKRDYYLELAVEESRKSAMSKKHGSVLVRRGKVLATGFNKYQGRSMKNFSWRDENELKLRRKFELAGGGDIHEYKAFTDKLWGKSACSIHAEQDAIMKAGNAARGSTLYVARTGGINGGDIMDSCPCVKCCKACLRLNIRVFYTR